MLLQVKRKSTDRRPPEERRGENMLRYVRGKGLETAKAAIICGENEAEKNSIAGIIEEAGDAATTNSKMARAVVANGVWFPALDGDGVGW